MNVKEYHECYLQLLSFEKNFRQFTQTKIGNSGLTLSHVMLMSYLYEKGGCGQKELTVTFNSSSAAMAVSISRLEELGYVSKIVDEEDKRNNLISLTEKGEVYFLSLCENSDSQKTGTTEYEKEGNLTREDLRNLAKLQKKLFQQMKEISSRA